MDLEKLIRTSLKSPACVLLKKHNYKTVSQVPVILTCQHCDYTLELPPDVLFHAQMMQDSVFKGAIQVPALGKVHKDIADGTQSNS